VVRELWSKLRADGVDPWLDKENLLPGENWDLEIRRAVRSSHIVIVCLSAESISKEGYVTKEIKLALDVADEKGDDTIFIIPLRLEDCLIPERLDKWQWVDFFECEREVGYGRLMSSLRRRAKQLGIEVSAQSEQIKPPKVSSAKRRNVKLRRDKKRSGQSGEERTYSPAEICQRFGLARSTLYRWEEQDEIPKPIRSGKKDERVYTQEHFRRIAELARKKIADEINAPSRYSADKAYPPFELAEKLYLLEIVSDNDPLHAVETLAALSKKHQLSVQTLDSLQEIVLERKAGDLVRRKILELLVEFEKMVADPDQ